MDAQAKRKTLFRAKLKAQKQEKQRIDSPLIKYDEHDQPVCRVCDVVIKSESLWPAHQASRKHHEAINKLKSDAAALNQNRNSKTEPHQEFKTHKLESHGESQDNSKSSSTFPKTRPAMPSDFFDNNESKRQKTGIELRDTVSNKNEPVSSKAQVPGSFASGSRAERSTADKNALKENPEFQASEDFGQVSRRNDTVEDKQVKGSLPEGFFDDKDSDLRARGITPVKPDVRDEYKEFEKLIQEDLQDIDERLEEEEFDAAEMIEEAESVDQRSYRYRVETLRRKKMELKASRSAIRKDTPKDNNHDDSSSDDENENIIVDWRAKRL